MPVVRSGTFILYGYQLTDRSTLSDGANQSPADPTNWYLCNSGNIVFEPDIPTPMPSDPVFAGPTLLDTSTEGNGFPAGSPPPGFVFRPGNGVSGGASLDAGFRGLAALNNAGTWSMGGKSGMSMTGFPGSTAHRLIDTNSDPLALYIELLDPLQFHVTRVDGFPFTFPFVSKTFFGSDPTQPPRITGSYDIVWWWWKLPDITPCGDKNTPNPETSTSHLVLAADQPPTPDGAFGEFAKLDPNDSDAAPQPVIKFINPTAGRAGTAVEIMGEGFGDDANVQFDGVDAAAIVIHSQYRITCNAPAHANGFANVVVINPDGVTS